MTGRGRPGDVIASNGLLLHSAGDGQDTITDFQNGDRLVLAGYTIDLHDLNFFDLDTNHDGLLGKGDQAASFTQDGDLVLNLAAMEGMLLPTPSRSRA